MGLFLLCAPLAWAEDVGDIAVFEDVTGQIMPAAGFCANVAYPRGLCLPPAGQAFFRDHPDNYDVLVVATNKTLNPMFDPKAAAPLNADIKGIGLDTCPWRYQDLGSAGRLINAVALGWLAGMPENPDDLYRWPPIRGVEVIAHEIAHRWFAYLAVDHGDGQGSRDILRASYNDDSGTIGVHWSSWFNTDGSIEYGGILTDNGDGTFTNVVGPPRIFNRLDQYLMGILPPEEVGPLWYVRVGYSLHGGPDMMEDPVTVFSGERVDFGIEDIVRANGPRVPASSPCHLKVAFAIAYPPGLYPSQSDFDKLNRYRLALEEYWIQASDGRGSLDTRLDGCGEGTETCPGEPSPHCFQEPADCEDGERRCNGLTLVQLCRNSHWVTVQTCVESASCIDGECYTPDEDGDIGEDGDVSEDVELPVDGDTPGDDDAPNDGDKDMPADGDAPADGDYDSINGDLPDGDGGSSIIPPETDGSTGGCAQSGGASLAMLLLALALVLTRRRVHE
ncbi:MAG: hypothetical protein C4523_05925 [Myxococcales bacterium]|nr:MAG: hypothetical protein C4523_05925 [Myxococcales bacterium]